MIITWVSWSWKTTLQQELLKRWWRRPINFTTRKPRNEEELDEYVFLNKEHFFYKLNKWDFLEFTNYNGNFYWVSNQNLDWNICVILDPVWREQVLEKLNRMNYNWNIILIHLNISEAEQKRRLKKRWDTEESIKIRANDFKWFSPHIKAIVLDWNLNIDDLVRKCETLKKI